MTKEISNEGAADSPEPDGGMSDITAGIAGAATGAVVSLVAGWLIGNAAGSILGSASIPVLTHIANLKPEQVSRVEQMVTEGASQAGLTDQGLGDWVNKDSRHTDLLISTVEGTWQTRDEDRLKVFAKVLAHGVTNEDLIDVDLLISEAWKTLSPPHVIILAFLSKQVDKSSKVKKYNGVDLSIFDREYPHLYNGIGALLASLVAHGCAYESLEKAHPDVTLPYYYCTDFGGQCIDFLQKHDAE